MNLGQEARLLLYKVDLNMGCGSSKGVVVPSNCNVRKSTTSIKESSTSKKNTSAKNSRTSLRSDKNNISPGSSAADFDENSGKRREISASSTRTADSGISESPQDEDVVTELSNPSKVIEVRASERPDTPGKRRCASFNTTVIPVFQLRQAYAILSKQECINEEYLDKTSPRDMIWIFGFPSI